MLKFNKKTYIYQFFGLTLIFASLFLFNISQANALSSDINQVKVPGESTVYFLSHATSQRKAYINEAVFLDYGNDWSEVKTISPEELAKWPEARLIKSAESDDLYYIRGSEKVKMNTLQDIINYNLENVLPITVSDFELSQYASEDSYEAAGLEKSAGLSVSQTLLDNSQSGNPLVAGTRDNQVMLLSFTAGDEAALFQDITFKLSGIYSDALVGSVSLVNANTGEKIEGSSSYHDRRLTFRFRQNSFYVPAGNTIKLKVLLDLNYLDNVKNQTMRLQLENAQAVTSNLALSGNFPLVGTEFKLLDAGHILGTVVAEEMSLGANGSAKNLGKFRVSEISGNEDVYIRQLIFRNNGSASQNDLELFKLRRGNQLIATASHMEDGQIIFDVNYLRLSAGDSLELSVSANLDPDYQSGRSVDLELSSLTAVGTSYNLSLAPSISNINESFLLP
ncbi:MAG: hypothetical protein PHG95_02090 [Patescibacteria group bacterium]|nr:hypothetical protein [Patescibacteria group bacterium]